MELLIELSARLIAARMRGQRTQLCLLLIAMMPVGCGAPDATSPFEFGNNRVITIALWAGHNAVEGADLAAPRIVERGPVTISGPIQIPDPVSGEIVPAYERVAQTPQGPRRQLLSQTHGRAGLGRVLDERPGLAARRFSDDLIFPLGKWRQGEDRSFAATEHTVLGPARRQITIEIVEIDFTFRDARRSMAYRLTITDAAGRILTCERYVYSPGIGLADFATDGVGPDGTGCNACPCPAALPG